jgi:transcription-repair coupling factor (superfamily II helicase)
LFTITSLKIQATPFGIRKIDAGPKGARIEFHRQPNIDPASIIELLQSAPGVYRLDGPERLRVKQDMPDVESRVHVLATLLNALAPSDPSGNTR